MAIWVSRPIWGWMPMIFGKLPLNFIFPVITAVLKSVVPAAILPQISYGPSNLKSAGSSAATFLAVTAPPVMSSTYDVARSVTVSVILVVYGGRSGAIGGVVGFLGAIVAAATPYMPWLRRT